MKCDELKVIDLGNIREAIENDDDVYYEYYPKSEVDASIAELKQKLHDVDNQWNEQCKEIAELKSKLESVQASAYADSVDAGMRERRLRRALWLARAERAKEMAKGYNAVVEWCSHSRWIEVERKCLKKAEEYR